LKKLKFSSKIPRKERNMAQQRSRHALSLFQPLKKHLKHKMQLNLRTNARNENTRHSGRKRSSHLRKILSKKVPLTFFQTHSQHMPRPQKETSEFLHGPCMFMMEEQNPILWAAFKSISRPMKKPSNSTPDSLVSLLSHSVMPIGRWLSMI
jgi:hypothetical protein